MTTEKDVLALLRFHPETPRIVGFGSNAVVLKMPDSHPNVLSIGAKLLDPETKDESDKWLFLQLQRDDAMILAKAILAVAKELGWPEPEAGLARTKPVNDGQIH